MEEFVKFYRIQGGTNYNSSRERLGVDKTKLQILDNKINSYIYIVPYTIIFVKQTNILLVNILLLIYFIVIFNFE